MIKVVSVIYLLTLTVVWGQQMPAIKSTLFQIGSIEEDYDIVHSFIHGGPSKFAVTVAPDFFVSKMGEQPKQVSQVQEDAGHVYVQLQKEKQIDVKVMEQAHEAIRQYLATKLINSNAVEEQKMDLPKVQASKAAEVNEDKEKQTLLRDQISVKLAEILQKKKTEFRIEEADRLHQTLIEKQPLIVNPPQLQKKPSLSKQPETPTQDNIGEEKQPIDEPNLLILIVVIVVIIIALCILLAVRSTSSDYEKIGEKANQTHETIVVNEEDEEGATMGLEGDDTSLNDELG